MRCERRSPYRSVLDGVEFGEGIAFNTRVGINTGPVVGGLVGSGDRVAYTVHGDNVNLTARLEQLNKDYGTRIIVAQSTRDEVIGGQFRFQGARRGVGARVEPAGPHLYGSTASSRLFQSIYLASASPSRAGLRRYSKVAGQVVARLFFESGRRKNPTGKKRGRASRPR